MTDYTKATGYAGTMMIRDTGTYVEFWLRSSSSATYNHALPWGYTINGATSGKLSFDFVQGGAWQRLGRWTITTDQTVYFRLYDTNTTGLGGPTTLGVAIKRQTVPRAPSTPTISGLTGTSAIVSFNDVFDGNLPITTRRISYGTASNATGTVLTSDRTTTISGLAQGTTYYVKAQTYNAKGWSPWSGIRAFKTYAVPPRPNPVVLTNVKQSTLHAKFSGNGDGGTPVLEWQIAYGTDPNTPQHTRAGFDLDITGLIAGQKYYFWARGRNSVGWGPYSVVSSATMVAGVRYKVGTQWVTAIPYVRHNGVWKPAQPFAKIAGLWKETG